MSVECPVCHAPVSRIRIVRTTAWGRWRCKGCGSLLGVDIVRRFSAFIPAAILLFVLIFWYRVTRLSPALAIPILVVAMLGWFMLVDRPIVHERCGFRCRSCAYDLKGLDEPICPECGTAFTDDDLAIQAAIRDGRPPPLPPLRNRGRAIAAAVIVVLLSLVITGIFVARRAGRTAPPAGAAATPIGAPAPEADGMRDGTGR